ncbi:unnamed protein product [Penicillium salamii]|uniref:Uncharacterized protein n=1 Tax=Penicillium salamii TaxID=1612424 RepID=A0A9W4N3H3_9EURO|nr:unnamed protein product [Penicillium salamii]
MTGKGGYALRRNESCLSTETDCGPTTSPFHACCPGNMFCPKGQLNVVCCQSAGECEQTRSNGCADPLANLYTTNAHNLTNGGFCCAQNKHGFSLNGDGAGCADEVIYITTSQTELSIVSSASGNFAQTCFQG